MSSKRIGIYAGAFDPVHAGHIGFALQAAKNAQLDQLYFLPERRPRYKQGVEHFGHRVAMLKRAARPYGTFAVLELDDISFSMQRSLPKLQKRFAGHQLVFLFGSDVVKQLPAWPKAENFRKHELVIGVRSADDVQAIRQQLAAWPWQPQALQVFESFAADVSSSTVREALRKRQYARGLLKSVARYSSRNWLYVSLSQ